MRVALYDSDDGDVVVGDGGVHDDSDYVVVDIVDNDDDDGGGDYDIDDDDHDHDDVYDEEYIQ